MSLPAFEHDLLVNTEPTQVAIIPGIEPDFFISPASPLADAGLRTRNFEVSCAYAAFTPKSYEISINVRGRSHADGTGACADQRRSLSIPSHLGAGAGSAEGEVVEVEATPMEPGEPAGEQLP